MKKIICTLLLILCTIGLRAQEISNVPFKVSVGTINRASLVKLLDKRVEEYAKWRVESNSSFDPHIFYNVHADFIELISYNTTFRQSTRRSYNVPPEITNKYSQVYISAYIDLLHRAINHIKEQEEKQRNYKIR
jgi:hypothetical protein